MMQSVLLFFLERQAADAAFKVSFLRPHCPHSGECEQIREKASFDEHRRDLMKRRTFLPCGMTEIVLGASSFPSKNILGLSGAGALGGGPNSAVQGNRETFWRVGFEDNPFSSHPTCGRTKRCHPPLARWTSSSSLRPLGKNEKICPLVKSTPLKTMQQGSLQGKKSFQGIPFKTNRGKHKTYAETQIKDMGPGLCRR